MDRTEKIGLGTAVGGHILLFGALSLGLLLSSQQIIKPQPIAVSLVGEISDVSTAPDATQEDTAPASSAPEDTPPDEAPPVPEVVPLPKVTPQPVTKPTPQKPKPVTASTKPAIKKVAQQTPTKPATRPTQTSSGKGQATSGGFKLPDNLLKGKGKSPTNTGTAQGTPAAKSAAEVTRQTRSTIASQIRIGSCMPSGLDVNKVVTRVTVRLAKDGTLSAITDISQTGMTDSNERQLAPIKDCITKSIRRASPFKGLDPAYHDVWQLITVPFQSKG